MQKLYADSWLRLPGWRSSVKCPSGRKNMTFSLPQASWVLKEGRLTFWLALMQSCPRGIFPWEKVLDPLQKLLNTSRSAPNAAGQIWGGIQLCYQKEMIQAVICSSWQAWRTGSQKSYLGRRLIYLQLGGFSGLRYEAICLPCSFWPQWGRDSFPSRFWWPFLASEYHIQYKTLCKETPMVWQTEVIIKESWSSFGKTTRGLDLVYLLCLYSCLQHKLGLCLLHSCAYCVPGGHFLKERTFLLITIGSSES